MNITDDISFNTRPSRTHHEVNCVKAASELNVENEKSLNIENVLCFVTSFLARQATKNSNTKATTTKIPSISSFASLCSHSLSLSLSLPLSNTIITPPGVIDYNISRSGYQNWFLFSYVRFLSSANNTPEWREWVR
jgi:hypothetical protein